MQRNDIIGSIKAECKKSQHLPLPSLEKLSPLNAVAFSCRSGREAPADWTGLPGSIARREMREDPAVRSQIRDSRRSGDFTGRKTV